MSSESTTELRLLGGFALVHEGRAIALPRSAQRLLALLALGGPSPRGRVAGVLWPDEPDQRALAKVRSAVWRAQRVGVPLRAPPGDQLRLSPDVRVDVRQLHTVVVAARSAIPALLPGWPDDWVRIQREIVRQKLMYALEDAAGEAIRHGDARRGLDLALAAVGAGPLRESAHRLVVRAHLALGDVAAANRHFDRTRALLRRELGVPPTPRFWQLVA